MSLRRANLTNEEMKSLVRSFFAQMDQGDLNQVERAVAQEIGNRQRQQDRNDPHAAYPTTHQNLYLCDEDAVQVRDILWDMIIEGYLRPGGKERSPDNWPSFHLTEKGKQQLRNRS